MSQPDPRPYTARPVASTPGAPRLNGDPNYRGRHRDAGWTDTGVLSGADLAAARGEAGGDSASGVSSYVVSHLRTLVPLLWGAGITWLADRYLPDLGALATNPTVLTVVTSGTTFLWYALWRWLEPHIPRALVAVLLGHPAEPSYPD